MSTSVPLTASQRADLHAALRHFGERDRQRGMQYLRQHRVLHLGPGGGPDEEAAFAAEVQGSVLYEVQWVYHGPDEWVNTCTCPLGGDCKHAYAAAMAALGTAPGTIASPGAHIIEAVPARASAAAPADEQSLVDLLAQRHGRALEKKERNFVRELAQLFNRNRQRCAIYEDDFARLGLADPSRYYRSHQPVLSDWWDAASAPASLLEFWQYLALFAERFDRALPPLMRPVTDVGRAREHIVARERRASIEHWTKLFASVHAATAPEAPAAALPREIRLRLTTPKLTWEFRDNAAEPWRPAKGAQAREWFSTLAASPGGADPATLALLQEVQLARTRQHYFTNTEPQTLRLDEPRTLDLIRWLLLAPTLRHLIVAESGEIFPEKRVPLRWLGRPLPDRPDDIVFDLIEPDGTPAPAEMLRLPGTPELALSRLTVFELPPPLPGHQPRSVLVPREALLTPAAAKRLRRDGVRVEGVELPEVAVVVLRPRFVCSLIEGSDFRGAAYSEMLHVELHAFSPDGALIQRRRSDGRWDKLRDTATAGPVREIEYERAEAAVPLLTELDLGHDYASFVWRRPAGARSFPELFGEWAERCRTLGIELECSPELAGLVRAPDRARVDVSVKSGDESSGIDWFDLEIAVRAEDTTLTEAELKLLLKAKGRFVRLPGKGWRRLEVELSPDEIAKLAELGLDAGALEGGSEKQRFHALQLADERIAGLLPAQHAARARERAAQLTTIAEPPVPTGLVAELRPYQKEGFHFLAHLSANGLGGVLADDMGLGKTVQALAWLLHLAAQRAAVEGKKAKPLRALVVCPKSVVPNWSLETRRFAPSLTAAPFADGTVPAAANLVVANYAQLRRAAKALGAEKWDAVILDEGQNIKNPQSQTARVARDLRAAHRIVLTGTPIENRTLDLWSLFAFAMPGLLGTQSSFKRAFNDREDPAAARARLARRVKHFMLRRTKGQVATDLPPRTEEDLAVELDGPQRRLYDAELKRTRAMLLGVKSDREFDQQRFNILQSLLRLRQICCDPRLIGFEDGKAKRASAKKKTAAAKVAAKTSVTAPDDDDVKSPRSGDTGSAKLEALLDTLEPLVEEGHRVLVFSQFVTMLELIAEELTARGIRHLMLTGQTENRQELVERFQSEQGEPVFLLSLKAAGSGLNLTAASYVVLYDPWWNPAVEAQAIDRTHRIGQTEHVIAYRLLARGTIEEKIRKLQQAKAELARSIVQEENLATVLSLSDLRFVLSEDPAE